MQYTTTPDILIIMQCYRNPHNLFANNICITVKTTKLFTIKCINNFISQKKKTIIAVFAIRQIKIGAVLHNKL